MGVPLSYVDIPVYISLSISQYARVLSPTSAWNTVNLSSFNVKFKLTRTVCR